ncbi:MAG TPA: carboxypeptidase-like regulatory domain-containing protein [Candidatus Sabulitectum sp.]|nr:carboxypeptidase-like regulatory domain-containing protein [Candidatus Sabulitectum sp.]HRW77668.1 carboxypeptidase-like regulatory domain-containing protein [Candidatus Sabulitectum sp.]
MSSTGNGSPVPGARVLLQGAELGVITDSDGSFAITGVLPGAYVLSVNSVGFHPRSLPDVIVRPGRETRVDAELEYSVLDAGGQREGSATS